MMNNHSRLCFTYFQCALWLCAALGMSALHAAPAGILSEPADRFADIASIVLESPAFLAHANLTNKPFTSDTEINTFIAKKIAPSPYADWFRLGKTTGGRDLNMVLFTQDGHSEPLSVAAHRKPTVWILAQQHGNEPAGSEAALEMMRRLVQTDLHHVLERINVVVVPRANPDGAANNQRETHNKGDMNRDHLFLGLLETQRLHVAMNRYPPSVLIDAHEFDPAALWQEHFGVFEASDVLVQKSSHPDIAEPITRLAHEVFDPALTAAWQAQGITAFPYHTLTLDSPITDLPAAIASHARVSMGTHAAGVARNALGLNNAVSYLIESRGLGLGKAHYQRRVASHVVSMMAILRTSALHADALRSAIREARKNNPLSTEWFDDDASRTPRAPLNITIPMLHLSSASNAVSSAMRETKPVIASVVVPSLLTLPIQASAHKPIANRALPLAYVVPQFALSAALQSKLRALGITFSRSVSTQEFELESFTLVSIEPERLDFDAPQDAERLFHLSTHTQRLKKTIDVGSLWIPMSHSQQQNWRTVAALFEPDSMGSLLSYASSYGFRGLFHTPYTDRLGTTSFAGMPSIGYTLPIYRVVGGTKLIAPQLMDKE
jgi:hypothetical protein